MNRDEVPPLMHPLEIAFKAIPPERVALYADILVRKNVTTGQLADAVTKAIERCDHFPSISALLKFAQEGHENAPRKDVPERTLEDILDAEETALRAMARKYTLAGRTDIAQDCQKRIDKIHLSRASRGLTTALRPTVETFDGKPLHVVERDWTEDDLVNPETGERGYPNTLSKRAGARMDAVIAERGWEPNRGPFTDSSMPWAKPATWGGDFGRTDRDIDDVRDVEAP